MDTAIVLEVAAQALTALMALWLGLTVATRSRLPSGRVFTWLALLLATWSSSIVVQRLTTSSEVSAGGRAVEEVTAALGLAALAHFALEISSGSRPSRRQHAVVGIVYVVLTAFAAVTLRGGDGPVAIDPPHTSLGFIPGAALGWAWVVARLATLVICLGWLLGAMRAPDPVALRRRQLRAATVAILLAGFGTSLRFLPVVTNADAWIGTSFIMLAIVSAAYAVFAAGIFFGPAVAARAFRASVVSAAAVAALVLLLLAVQAVSSTILRLDSPYFAVLGLVVVAALYGPVGSRVGGGMRGSGARVARDRLMRAIGEPALTAGSAAAGVSPALEHVTRALDVTGLSVAVTDGLVVESGGPPPASGAMTLIPLMNGNERLGELRVGGTASGAPLDARDVRLLELSATYVASALRTGRREDQQVAELTRLIEERTAVDAHAAALHTALAERAGAPPGLRVLALGPLRTERAGKRIEHWGGDKAGSRQAQGLFAFLYDRGERGVAKDEVLELIWPDADLERADLAFHRTMGGLRSTLEPGHRTSGRSTVQFTNDRYRLGDSVVAWSDVDAFLASLDAAAVAADGPARLRLLEEARRLYRGEYLDDCPYYGDSVFVEERRALLRDRCLDLLVALGEAYETGADRMSAAAAFRDALSRAPDGCPPASAGLARLGL